MASAAVAAAVAARMGSSFGGYPVIAANTAMQTPADGGAFWVIQFPVAAEEQISVGAPGANLWRESGAIRLVLQIPRGSGTATWLALMDSARTLFRGARFGGVETFGPSPPVLDDRNEDGGYWALSSAIPYEFDILG